MKKLGLAIALILPMTLFADDHTTSSSYFFPDEWAKHKGTILILPSTHSYGKKTAALQEELASLANAIVKNEAVYVFVHSSERKRAKALLDKKVKIIVSPRYRIDWARDTAPLFTINKKGQSRAVCFQFNGWGKKYEGWERDQGNQKAIAKYFKVPILNSKLVLEGGAIEIGSTDKGRTGIVTEQCVLNKNRTSWSKAKIEAELKRTLGLDRVIWLPKGLNPDPITDGHVDGLLKFVAKNTVLLHKCDDKLDVNFKICADAKKRLIKAGLKVVDLPLADDVVPMNFYIGSAGKVVYVPISGDPKQDRLPLKIIGQFFKTVVPIKAKAFARSGGGIHCQTQQIPAPH